MTDPARSPLLVLTPHSSGALPAPVLHQMLGEAALDPQARAERLRHVFLEGDPYTDLLFLVPGARTLNAPWSRFVVDLNRERDDASDNGVVKATDFARAPLYPVGAAPSAAERERRLSAYWDSFDVQVRAELPGTRLLLVGHCMAAVGPSLGPDRGRPRPALTLMVGEGDHPTFPPEQVAALKAAAEQAFTDVLAGAEVQDVRVGDPWTTDDLSLRYHRAAGVAAFGLEMNAGLYLTPGGEARWARIRALNAGLREFARRALELV